MGIRRYDSKELKRRCRERGIFYGILAKGKRGRGLSGKQKRRNRIYSQIRRRVERVFGIMSLHLQKEKARYVGLLRNEIHLFLTCFTYNLLNLFWQLRREGVV